LLRAFGVEPADPETYLDTYHVAIEQLRPYVGDADAVVHESLALNQMVLLEGAQAALLDIDAGTYPYVTSSGTLAAGALAGSGVPPMALTHCVGVYKLYPTRVGEGPFPTEMEPVIGDRVREIGHEFGVTTGRPRRCGWFDAVAGRYSMQLNGYSAIALTHLDVFDTLPCVRICVGYRLDGAEIMHVPPCANDLARCEPIYEEMPGWEESTIEARTPADLPRNARAYIERIEGLIGASVALVTVGPHRDEAVSLQPLL
jgi:adenylosuccinate synthase